MVWIKHHENHDQMLLSSLNIRFLFCFPCSSHDQFSSFFFSFCFLICFFLSFYLLKYSCTNCSCSLVPTKFLIPLASNKYMRLTLYIKKNLSYIFFKYICFFFLQMNRLIGHRNYTGGLCRQWSSLVLTRQCPLKF
jgi:hypothetical protein